MQLRRAAISVVLYVGVAPVIGGLLFGLSFVVVNGMPTSYLSSVALYSGLGGYFYGLVPAMGALATHHLAVRSLSNRNVVTLVVAIAGGVCSAGWVAWVMWPTGSAVPQSSLLLLSLAGSVGAMAAAGVCHTLLVKWRGAA